jgi:hypothetical protein
MQLSELRRRSWFGDINCLAEERVASGRLPPKFVKLLPIEELHRLRKNQGLPTDAISWMQTDALTLFLALREAPRRSIAEVRKDLQKLIGHFKSLSKALARLDFAIEWELDAYKETNSETGEPSFGPTANPPLANFKQHLSELVQRAGSIGLPKSKAGRLSALTTLALWGLASDLRETQPNASGRDLAQLATQLFDPILLEHGLRLPRWQGLAQKAWPATKP